MMPPLRIIDTGERPARWNVAATAALTELHCSGRIGDTLRFHRYPSSVLVGRHQALDQSIRLRACAEAGIEIARRVTGGGSVYMAPGALAWDLIIDRTTLGGSRADAARTIGDAIAAGIARLGLAAQCRAGQEVEIAGRKVCGMSGYREGDTIACQGTILVDTDLRDIGHYLRLPANRLRGIGREIATRTATISEFLGRLPDRGELECAITCGVVNALGCEPIYRMISPEERMVAEQRHREEYGQDTFVYGDPPAARRHAIVGRDGGVNAFIRLLAGKEPRIHQIWLTGSFSVSPPRTIPDLEAALRGTALAEAPVRAAEFLDQRAIEIRGASRYRIAGAILSAHQAQAGRS